MNISPLKAALAVAGVAIVAGVGTVLAFDDIASPEPIELSAAPSDASDASDSSEPDAAQDDAPSDVGDDAPSPAPSTSSIDEAEARRFALEEVGDGEVVHIEADRDDGRAEWEDSRRWHHAATSRSRQWRRPRARSGATPAGSTGR